MKVRHECFVCHKVAYWNKNWNWYGSIEDTETGKPTIKTCSDECRAQIKYPNRILSKLQKKLASHV